MLALQQDFIPDLNSAASARDLLAVFFNITREWGLSSSQEQQLLGTSKTTLFVWKSGQVKSGLDMAVLERLSYVLRIYAALEMLLPIPERAVRWIKEPNRAPLFGGAPALQRLLAGQVGDLKVVADYLDAQRGGDFA